MHICQVLITNVIRIHKHHIKDEYSPRCSLFLLCRLNLLLTPNRNVKGQPSMCIFMKWQDQANSYPHTFSIIHHSYGIHHLWCRIINILFDLKKALRGMYINWELRRCHQRLAKNRNLNLFSILRHQESCGIWQAPHRHRWMCIQSILPRIRQDISAHFNQARRNCSIRFSAGYIRS